MQSNCFKCFCCVCLILGFASLAIILGIYMYYDILHHPKHEDCKEEYACNHLLSPDVIPKSYSILLHPDLVGGKFTGDVSILAHVSKPQKYIYFHSKGLNITSAEITLECRKEAPVEIVASFEYPKNEFWVLKLNKSLEAGDHCINLKFFGKLTQKIVGFYRSVYTDITTGNERSIATSKFEPTYARQAFPCFDEPAYKAKFSIKLVRPSDGNYIALSNMNQVGEEPDKPSSGLTTVSFAESVPMSTYLACFIVCDFKAVTSKNSKSSPPITAYARPGQEKSMEFALSIGEKAIEYYIKYFNIPYPLPKLDLIAIPDFISGAMEHWGLVTFRETSVLFSPTESSLKNKKAIASTVAHELAHMWFGNLVTMKWWNDLWLNEGFASFMQYKGVHASHPEWDMDTQFLIGALYSALDRDGQLSSHPIVQDVSHPDQITEIFDIISYQKGSSIIRMCEAFMGESAFQQGVSSYLESFKYGNAQTKDLWNHLQKFSKDAKIDQVMATWTDQMGYPVLTVEKTSDGFTVNQKRFLSAVSLAQVKDKKDFISNKWDVPLMYCTSNNSKSQLVWLHQTDESIHIKVPSDTTWIKLNSGNYGYYLTNYDSGLWDTLSTTLKSNSQVLPAADRANLVFDAFNLAKAEHISYEIPLKLVKYIKSESHAVPLSVASDKFSEMKQLLRNTDAFKTFLDFGKKLIVFPPNVWEFSNDISFQEGEFKSTLLGFGCAMELEEFLNTASNIFKNWLLQNGSKPHPEIRALVYNHGMRANSNLEIWMKLWKKYTEESTPSEKLKLMVALTTVKDKAILEKLLEFSKNESLVRSQDFFSLLGIMSKNPIGTELLWSFVRNEWTYLVDRFTLNDRYFGLLIPSICSSFSTEEKLQEMKDFFAKYPEAGAGASGRHRALETVQNNIRWHKVNYQSIAQFLQKEASTS